jgi:hypothetical protein
MAIDPPVCGISHGLAFARNRSANGRTTVEPDEFGPSEPPSVRQVRPYPAMVFESHAAYRMQLVGRSQQTAPFADRRPHSAPTAHPFPGRGGPAACHLYLRPMHYRGGCCPPGHLAPREYQPDPIPLHMASFRGSISTGATSISLDVRSDHEPCRCTPQHKEQVRLTAGSGMSEVMYVPDASHWPSRTSPLRLPMSSETRHTHRANRPSPTCHQRERS